MTDRDTAETGRDTADAEAREREVFARMDDDLACITEQGNAFQGQFNAMMAAWQPVPPEMFAYYAQGLTQWIEHFQQSAGPEARALAEAGRPAAGERLAAIVAHLEKMAAGYRQMAGEQVAHAAALSKVMLGGNTFGPIANPAAATNREVAGINAATNAERTASFERQALLFRQI